LNTGNHIALAILTRGGSGGGTSEDGGKYGEPDGGGVGVVCAKSSALSN